MEKSLQKSLDSTHEQVKNFMGDVTGISLSVVVLCRNKFGERVMYVGTAGPLRVMLW